MAPMSSPASKPQGNHAARTERERLRDYYGLAATTTKATSTAGPSSSSQAEAAVAAQTVPELLRVQSDLLTQIRELDGERQSLVYNHHTDLVAASETIAKMKKHAESLDTTLSTLTQSFQAMNKLDAQLKSALLPITSKYSSKRGEQASPSSPSSSPASSKNEISRQIIPVVTMPQRLRDTIALASFPDELRAALQPTDDQNDCSPPRARSSSVTGLAAAEALWGRHEAILSEWSREGVPGADAVASECRAVLKEERERIVAARSSTTGESDRRGQSDTKPG